MFLVFLSWEPEMENKADLRTKSYLHTALTPANLKRYDKALDNIIM